MSEVLSLRQINRATLARQMLLERSGVGAASAISQLVSLQAQIPKPPFIGLWTRLEAFEKDQLLAALRDRSVVRAPAMMRHTVHVMASEDFLRFRTTIQPALTRGFTSITRNRIEGIDMDALLAEMRKKLADGVITTGEMLELAEQFEPEGDHSALRYGLRTFIPLVNIPDDSAWGFGRTVSFADPTEFLGEAPDPAEHVRELIKRYLAAFGPASPADAQAWSGLAGLKPTFESMRSELLSFKTEESKEIFDLPDAPRPASDIPAPVRFLPDYDNLVVSHADRRRVMSEEHRPRVSLKAARVRATFTLDGFVAGTWRVEKKGKRSTLVVEPFAKLAKRDRKLLEDEGERLLAFIAEDEASGVVFSAED